VSLAVVRICLRCAATARLEELATFQTDVLAGLVLARAAAGQSDATIPRTGDCRRPRDVVLKRMVARRPRS
jgi:hypothetical protein